MSTQETKEMSSGTPEDAATTKASSTSPAGAAAKKVCNKKFLYVNDPRFCSRRPRLVFQVAFKRPPEPEFFRGKEGLQKSVASNYLKLQLEADKGIYHYEVDFEPRVDNRQECFRLMNSLSNITGPVKVSI